MAVLRNDFFEDNILPDGDDLDFLDETSCSTSSNNFMGELGNEIYDMFESSDKESPEYVSREMEESTNHYHK